MRLPVRAAFLRPGVYDLNRFRFVVHMAADSAQLVPGVVGARLRVVDGRVRVPYIFSAQYVVTVEDADAAGAIGAEQQQQRPAGPPPPQQQQQQAGGARAIQHVLSSALGLATAAPSSSSLSTGGADGAEEALVTLVEKTSQMSLAGPAGASAGAAVDGSSAATGAPPAPPTPGSGGFGFHDVVPTPNVPQGSRLGSPTPAGGASAFRFEAEGEQEQDGGGAVEVQEHQRFNEEGQERAAALLELQDGGEAAAEGKDGETGEGERGAL